MKLAFCLFEYFPYGGLQRECLRLASACAAAGADVSILTREWQGEHPHDCTIKLFPSKGMTNAKRVQGYIEQVDHYIKNNFYDGVIGFNKMPGLDLYYACDPCFIEKAKRHGPLYRFTQNYKIYSQLEASVFGPESKTKIMMISPAQQKVFQEVYQLPDERICFLAPGISVDRCAPIDYESKRSELREAWEIQHKHIVLMIGSGFKTKGLDRALKAVAALPHEIRHDTEFWIAGQDDSKPYHSLINRLGIESIVHFLGGRDDISELLWASDCLIHPAYAENTGTVLLEAAVAGLPVICTEVCGYAHYIQESQSGIVLSEPFKQEDLDHALLSVLRQPQPYRKNGIKFGLDADLYSGAEQAQQLIMQEIRQKP